MERNIALGQTRCASDLRFCFGAFAQSLQDRELRVISQVAEELFLTFQTTSALRRLPGFELLRLVDSSSSGTFI